MNAETDLLARIDALTACASCGGPMAGSVSDDFCSSMCQRRWHADHADDHGFDYSHAGELAGYGRDAARWVPHVAVGDWSIPTARAAELLDTARTEAAAIPSPTPIRVPVDYVAPARTDNPAEDVLVAAVAAAWAERLGRPDDAATARRLEAAARADVPLFAMRAMVDSVAEGLRRIEGSWAEMAAAMRRCFPQPHAPTAKPSSREDVAQRALAARQSRNTGPTVHADPRRNRR